MSGRDGYHSRNNGNEYRRPSGGYRGGYRRDSGHNSYYHNDYYEGGNGRPSGYRGYRGEYRGYDDRSGNEYRRRSDYRHRDEYDDRRRSDTSYHRESNEEINRNTEEVQSLLVTPSHHQESISSRQHTPKLEDVRVSLLGLDKIHTRPEFVSNFLTKLDLDATLDKEILQLKMSIEKAGDEIDFLQRGLDKSGILVELTMDSLQDISLL